MKFLLIGLLLLAGCSTTTTFRHLPDDTWEKSVCKFSSKEYELWNRQYHCDVIKVTAQEAKFAEQ